MGSQVFTSSENVKTDDTEVEANEQMMRSVGGEKGMRERKKRKFSQCQMEEQLAPLSLLWGWIFLYRTHTHIHTTTQTNMHTHTCRATSCHSTPPAQHLVIKARPRRALIFSGERKN